MQDHSQLAYSVGPTSYRQWADGGPLLDFYWAHTWSTRLLALQLRKCAVCSQVAYLIGANAQGESKLDCCLRFSEIL